MSFYPDTNFLLRLCAQSDAPAAKDQVDRALRWLAKKEYTVICSPLTVYETRKQLWLLPEPARVKAEEELARLLATWEPTLTGWSEAIDSALLIARDFRSRLIVDSADTLHVGWAQAEQCVVFGSFDTNSGARALAYARGLKVWPDMTDKDFANFARLKA